VNATKDGHAVLLERASVTWGPCEPPPLKRAGIRPRIGSGHPGRYLMNYERERNRRGRRKRAIWQGQLRQSRPQSSSAQSRANTTSPKSCAGLRSRPRVRKGADIEFYGGPQHYNKDYMEPKDGLGQTLHIHLEGDLHRADGRQSTATSTKRSFLLFSTASARKCTTGSATSGKGGDIAIVHNNCVHQHFNRSPDKPARALVMKTKPQYLFMTCSFQKNDQSDSERAVAGCRALCRGSTRRSPTTNTITRTNTRTNHSH